MWGPVSVCFLVSRCFPPTLAKDDLEHSSGLFLFAGLPAILSYFINNTDPLAQDILSTFQTDCFYVADPKLPAHDDPKRKPFIVIEGNYRPSRDSAGKQLADLLGGKYMNNPAPCLTRYVQHMPAGSFLRRAYFALSMYATDFNVRVHLSTGRPVVLNGCWLDQLSYSLIQTFETEEEIPSVDSQIFTWPDDLLQPDLTFYLSLPNPGRRNYNSWQGRSMELYSRLQSRYNIVMKDHKVMADIMYTYIAHNLAGRRDVRLEARENDSPYAVELFSGLEEVLHYFRNNSNPLAKRILETFEQNCSFKDLPPIPTDKTRKPFIVIEGNGHTSRDIVGKGLARKINGRYMVHPAACLTRYLDIMPKGTVLRRAFFILSLYATANNIRAHLSTNRAVVLNGYYLDQVAFSLIQTYPAHRFPNITADIFQQPAELLPADLIVYLHLDDDLRTMDAASSRAGLSWYTRSLQLYQSLQAYYPLVIERLVGNDTATTEVVFKKVQERLSATRDVVAQDYDGPAKVLGLFAGFQGVLGYFRNSRNSLAKEILSTFETHCYFRTEPLPDNRKSFIVLEGNNRTSKDVVGTRLAKIMNGVILRHPAPCLKEYTNALPKSSMLRRAFYVLSLYAMAFEVQRYLPQTTVFLNGYWLDQLTFALIQCYPYGRLPPVTSPIFRWPEDLLQPDLIVYLNCPDDLHQKHMLSRSRKNWKPRSLELYQQLQEVYNIKIQELDTDYWKTTDQIYQHITYNA